MSRTKDAGPERLTTRQQQVLDLIRHAIAQTGAPPTRAEIAAELGFRSANAAEEHLQALARKGAIELVSGTSRGIRLRPGPKENEPATTADAWSRLTSLALPLVGRVAAGHPILAEEHIEQVFHVEASLFSHKPDYLLKVRGLSMRDAGIMDGDLLAVARSQDAQNGDIIVARVDGEVTVKRFQRYTDRIELLPENPDFAPIIIRADVTFDIEGRAVGLVRPHCG